MVYLIHLELTRSNVKHCIAILQNDAHQTLNLYYIQPHSSLMTNLLALGVEWTVIRLWEEEPWHKQWPWRRHKADRICPVCAVKC